MITLKRLRAENFKLLRQLELLFPRQGSVLIEGLNESGKSTLFESVYYALYGTPLNTEGRGKGTLESVIRYGADSAAVELLLEVDETELEIRRTVARNRPSQAALTVRRPDAPEERVAGVLAVSARVVEELGGLDGEALLNSCFVEQKKLSKLEDLAIGQRRDSLRKLLNLEKLTDLADRFKVTVQDERALAQARNRLELAEVAAQLPRVAGQRSALEAAIGGASAGRAGSCAPPPGGPAEPSVPTMAPDGREAEAPWAEPAARLAALHRTRAAAGRRGRFAVGVAVLGLLAVPAGLSLMPAIGHPTAVGPWLALALALVLLSVVIAVASFRGVAETDRQVAELSAKLSAWRDTLVARIGELEGRRRRLEEPLGTDAATLDVGECRLEVERLARQLEVKRRAGDIVEGAMERIVRMVLPNTERNLGQILPLLTAGRYHEARIAEDYQVQVWDDSAGRYVSKSVFSGGARDQFSLALRLAFALATLPQELGTTPGFIFLDEPLSSFDGPRTEALVQLLTTGQVADSFSQIFVISHNRSFDVGVFQYRLLMRDGRAVESNLPAS
ncbi:MAG: ATP-binding protein [Chloroflexota bacterium]